MEHLSLKEESENFYNHLNLENNHYLIFSGIFGIGKTYFINDFFKEHQEKYVTIKISPVNYAVSRNEDIFEYIKYDVAFEALKQYPLEDEIEIGKNLYWQVYLAQNFKSIAWDLVKSGSKIDRRFDSVISSIKVVHDHLQKAKQGAANTEKKLLTDFFTEMEDETGGIYENNYTTQLVKGLVEDIKISKQERLQKNHGEIKKILVIDDLDRIDPEHIFRILNVFSAHADHAATEHKLGFDKIILICDIQNIRNIFHARYGSETDFSGYIDKFYSSEIYEYNFGKVVAKNIYKFFNQINYSGDRLQYVFNNDAAFICALTYTLKGFLNANAINTRTLVNFLTQPFVLEQYLINVGDKKHLSTIRPIFLFDVLEKICGGEMQLKKALEKTAFKFKSVSNFGSWSTIFGDLIMLLDVYNNNFESNDEEVKVFKSKSLGFSAIYVVQNYGDAVSGEARLLKAYDEELTPTSYQNQDTIQFLKKNMPFFYILLKAYETKIEISE